MSVHHPANQEHQNFPPHLYACNFNLFSSMRFLTLAASALSALLSAAILVSAQAHDTPELSIVTTFPNNPFSSKLQTQCCHHTISF